MLINDYSQQNWTSEKASKITASDLITAGMIFLLPVIFLLVISAK
ncbi:MAG TPA: hypothetical protein PLI45_04815 [Candidatus Woesebacteria bacterium]|nr:hypothetical protein [Candidatus Woesebacteria bacterium]